MKKFITIIIAFHASLFTFHLSAQVVNGKIVSDTNNLTVVKLWGTSEERGFAYGYLMGDKIAFTAEEWIIPYYGDDLDAVRALIQEGTRIKIDSVYQNEANAVIAGMDAAGFNTAGYDYLDILAGSIWQDMGSWPLMKKKDRFDCSAFMNWGSATTGTDLNGCSVISHHLDWFFIPEHCFSMGSIVVHIPSEEGQQPWLIVDFAGYLAPGSGCNASGYCIATEGLSGVGSPDTNASYVPYRFMYRSVLETSDYNLDGVYNMEDFRAAISDQEQGYPTGSNFAVLGPSTESEDSLIAMVAEVAPEYPFITFRTNSYFDTIPGDNLYAANSEIARNNSRNYCYRYLRMVDTIGDGTNIGSEANWEMMRVHSNGGGGNLVFMQFIPEWNQLKLSFCQKINNTIYPAYQTEPSVFLLNELFGGVPAAHAGNNATICENTYYSLNGEGLACYFVWTTTGDGTFSDSSILNPVYTPGAGDITSMGTDLILTGYLNSEMFSTDTMSLNIIRLPEIPPMPEGPETVDLNYTTTSEYSITGSSPFAVYLWELLPEEAGIISGTTASSLVEWNTTFYGNAFIRAKEVDSCGEGEFSEALEVLVYNSVGGVRSVDGWRRSEVSGYPNPFSYYTVIEYELAKKAEVTMTIFNYLGQEVTVLVEEEQDAGRHKLTWNAEGSPAGVYFIQLTVKGEQQTANGKLVVVR